MMCMPTTAETFLPAIAPIADDFDFLDGFFDVRSRRLSEPMSGGTGSGRWIESTATSIARIHLAGGVSVDELYFPDRKLHGMSVRVFDPVARRWSVYWVDSATGVLQPPVIGAWEGGRCLLTRSDSFHGRPILCSYGWSDVGAHGGHWEQAFSVDDGKSWQLNWEMDFIRRESRPDHTIDPRPATDFDFLTGRFQVEHRKLDQRLAGSDSWQTFSTTSEATTYFGGSISVDEIDLQDGVRGMTVRIRDPRTGLWSLYWINSRLGQLTTPVVGGFDEQPGEFVGTAEEDFNGRPIIVRFIWSDISGDAPHWQQAFSEDNGQTWETNWHMSFTRIAG
jgi:hypothetical protein